MTCLQKRISHEEAQICVCRVCRLVSESELTGSIFMELMGGGPKPYKATNYIISNKLHKMISFPSVQKHSWVYQARNGLQ